MVLKPICQVLAISALFFWSACTNDELPEPSGPANCNQVNPTYDGSIRPIIDNSCAYSSCHLDVGPGIYTSYAGLLPALESGQFEERVITLRSNPVLGMPPDNAPEGRPMYLKQEELELIQCWLAAGYPEN